MTMNDCIKCGKLSNEKKILVNSIYLDIEKDVNKDCEKCIERASKKPQELSLEIAKKPEIRTKNYILAALKEQQFQKCEIEIHENIPINEIGPMNGMLMGIDLREVTVGDFFWLCNHIKEKHQNFNESIMLEFPIILVTPPCRGIKRKSDDVKLKYYVEDGNHRLLKWIDSGNKTVPAAFVIIDKQHTSGYADNWPNPLPNVRLI